MILGEATSAIDGENEVTHYEKMRIRSAVIIGVGPRPHVAKFFSKVLLLTGRLRWEVPSGQYFIARQAAGSESCHRDVLDCRIPFA